MPPGTVRCRSWPASMTACEESAAHTGATTRPQNMTGTRQFNKRRTLRRTVAQERPKPRPIGTVALDCRHRAKLVRPLNGRCCGTMGSPIRLPPLTMMRSTGGRAVCRPSGLVRQPASSRPLPRPCCSPVAPTAAARSPRAPCGHRLHRHAGARRKQRSRSSLRRVRARPLRPSMLRTSLIAAWTRPVHLHLRPVVETLPATTRRQRGPTGPKILPRPRDQADHRQGRAQYWVAADLNGLHQCHA